LARRSWDVLESEDESLLLTLLGPWGMLRPWEVFDAEDRLVCTIHGGLLFDSGGVLRARHSALADPPRQSFLSTRGEELAWFRPAENGVELMFLPPVQDDPYSRMSLLGATLAALEDSQS
jgi:hypothetical protein